MARRPHVVPWLCLACLVVGLAACGGSSTPARAESPSAQLQGMVDIGDRSLLLRCRGTGGPTVVLEAGLADDLSTWDSVRVRRQRADACLRLQPGQHRRRATQHPDRARRRTWSMTWSTSSPPPTSPRRIVLVGFSFGGLVVQQFAATHPDDVAGVVLVESNHPDEQRQFESHLTRRQIRDDRAEVAGQPRGCRRVLRASTRCAPPAGFPPSPSSSSRPGCPWNGRRAGTRRCSTGSGAGSRPTSRPWYPGAARSLPGRAATASRTSSPRSWSAPSRTCWPGPGQDEAPLYG